MEGVANKWTHKKCAGRLPPATRAPLVAVFCEGPPTLTPTDIARPLAMSAPRRVQLHEDRLPRGVLVPRLLCEPRVAEAQEVPRQRGVEGVGPAQRADEKQQKTHDGQDATPEAAAVVLRRRRRSTLPPHAGRRPRLRPSGRCGRRGRRTLGACPWGRRGAFPPSSNNP